MTLNCPACTAPLQPVDYEGASIHTCNGCGGEFLAGTALAHIVHTRDETFAPDIRLATEERSPTQGIPDSESKRQVDCPACSNPMNVVNYATDTGIYIDKCAACGGVWLDGSELEHIQALSERWQDEAPEQIRGIASQLETARQRAAANAGASFQGSRFAFVNAVINRLLDAA